MKWSRKKFKSKKRKDTERKKRTIAGVSLLVGIAALIIGTSYLSALEGVTIDTIVVEGNEVIDAEDIERVARQEMSGRYLWLYARSNALIYPRKHVRRAIQDEFLRIRDIRIELDSMDLLRILVTEREPYGIWCGTEFSNEIAPENEECSFVDVDGVIYASAPSFSGDVFLRMYGEQKNNHFSTKEDFKEIRRLFNLLESEEIKPTVAVLRESDTLEVTVDDLFGHTSVLFVDLETSPEETVRNLLTLYSELTSVRGENRTDPHLEYVDLRFGNRVFYNLMEEDSFTAPSTSVQ
ncbi:MAG: hypothetical protein WD579_01055 [Candidatus Paceibacterota bacterium]